MEGCHALGGGGGCFPHPDGPDRTSAPSREARHAGWWPAAPVWELSWSRDGHASNGIEPESRRRSCELQAYKHDYELNIILSQQKQ